MSWREADDPRCPECGDKISPTAYYCMHCHADLPDDEKDPGYSSTPDEILGDDEFGELSDTTAGFDRGDGFGSQVGASLQTLTGRDRHKLDGIAGRLASMLFTDVPEPEGVSRDTFTAPLWMRFPVAFVSGIFVFLAVGFTTLVLFDDWLGPLGGTATFLLFALIIWWLARKPLPSDILGDACYAIALAVLVLPAAMVANSLVAQITGAGGTQTLTDLVVGGVVMQIFVLFPASLFLIIGYVGNRYARSKLDGLADSATDPTNG
jgi:DNA-directed RNA polymerase subunit RPC12/RpoP